MRIQRRWLGLEFITSLISWHRGEICLDHNGCEFLLKSPKWTLESSAVCFWINSICCTGRLYLCCRWFYHTDLVVHVNYLPGYTIWSLPLGVPFWSRFIVEAKHLIYWTKFSLSSVIPTVRSPSFNDQRFTHGITNLGKAFGRICRFLGTLWIDIILRVCFVLYLSTYMYYINIINTSIMSVPSNASVAGPGTNQTWTCHLWSGVSKSTKANSAESADSLADHLKCN